MFRNRCCERPMAYANETNFSQTEVNQDFQPAMPMMGAGMGMGGCGCDMPPVHECPQERVCHREIVHNVPHIVPINTRIINHHIYRHTYTPCYTCCEENEVTNVYDNCPKHF